MIAKTPCFMLTAWLDKTGALTVKLFECFVIHVAIKREDLC